MGWKKWPSWVKGGIMGLIISIFLVVLFFVDVVQNGGSSLISQMIVNLCEFYTR